MKSQIVSHVSRKEVPKTIASLERWARTLDVFYVRDFGVLLGPLEEMDIDVTKVKAAWEAKDWNEICSQQLELMRDWESELSEKKIRIPRCAVYFFSTMDRKRYGVRRQAFGDCDRHVTQLPLYELIMSCVYRQMNHFNLFRDDEFVTNVMFFHRPWFQWMTDVQRLIIWTRRREYENIGSWSSVLKWKIERLNCDKCSKRYAGLIERMTKSYMTVVAYGKPFNHDNYYGSVDEEMQERIDVQKRLKEREDGGR